MDRVRFLGCVVVLIEVLLSGGCTRKVYVPVESVVMRKDTVYSVKVLLDSVIQHDSVAVVQRGDTVYYSRYRDRIRVKERTDTLYQATTDSVERRVSSPVERELTRWERVKMDAGGFAFSLLAAVAVMGLIALIIWLIIIRRRK